MTEIVDKPIRHFLDELASRSPTPGGGSVAALMGAQGAALVGMVCNLTLGKPQYAEAEATMQDLLARSEALRAELTAMVKADVDVFEQLMASYGLPKTTDEEKAARSEAIQSVLKEATEVPLACARACYELIMLAEIAATYGYLGVISDAGVAVMAAHSGLKSAALNVYINTGGLKDRDFAELKLNELATLLNGLGEKVNFIFQLVKDKL